MAAYQLRKNAPNGALEKGAPLAGKGEHSHNSNLSLPMKASPRDRVGPMLPPPLFYAAGLAVGWLIAARFPVYFLPGAAGVTVSSLCIVTGTVFIVSAVTHFARAKTSVIPIRPTTALVEGGPYRMTRNPMYVGFTFVYIGIALLANWLWAVVLLPLVVACVYFAAIVPEERFLHEKFGAEYDAYRSRVRRWL